MPQITQPTGRLFLSGLLAALSLLTLAGPALGQANPYSIGARVAFGHDSNLFRTEFSPQPDKYAIVGLQAGIDQPFGRQRFYANGTVNATRYEDIRELDNTGYGLNAGLDWETIERLSGGLNVAANQSLAQYGASVDQPLLTRKNIETSQEISARVQLGMASLMSLNGSVSHRRVGFSAPEFAGSEYSQNAGSLGVRYRPSDLLTLGAGLRATRGEYPNITLISGDTATYRRNDLDLTGTWTVSGLSTIDARLSFGSQTSDLRQRDFSGATGSISWAYLPTGKLSFNTTLTRDTGAETGFSSIGATQTNGAGDNSVLTTSLSLSAAYAATAKIRLNAGLRYVRRSLADQAVVGGVAGPTIEGSDTLTSVSLGANYEPTRNWQLGCNAVRDSRSASGGLSTDYTATTANCSAQFTIR